MTDFVTNYVTSLHIVSLSALRFAAIKWPLIDMKLSNSMLVFYVMMLWFASLIAALPLGYMMGVDVERGDV